MNTSAVEQARKRLGKARHAVARLKDSSSYEDSEDAWTDFLLACSAIYSKLEQGAKKNGKSLAWFGRKKHERKKDDLLRYVHFARNTDEHGIERITAQEPGNNTRMIRPTYGERHPITAQVFDPKTGERVGGLRKGVMDGARLRCVRVVDDRYGDACDPPLSHLGKPIHIPEVDGIRGGDYPDVIAGLVLDYLETLVSEAETLAS
ncbi:hypothetical protein [Allomesorhizobium alhagi]|uniref:hypothetical protein n=1 Tax=Allomesorhizobium alhagi TaxID=475067 RepID=UPI001112C4FC|nr:hypothetical protein [Mesorhizobium alhagi]